MANDCQELLADQSALALEGDRRLEWWSHRGTSLPSSPSSQWASGLGSGHHPLAFLTYRRRWGGGVVGLCGTGTIRPDWKMLAGNASLSKRRWLPPVASLKVLEWQLPSDCITPGSHRTRKRRRSEARGDYSAFTPRFGVASASGVNPALERQLVQRRRNWKVLLRMR
ncbi:unnamed protein product [Pleuronectes platessa]|uniref:Uncharacterized protein n=1 Tax=Pleuronectes platessa TaxID=8262 RepID=A0A9N7TW79_PLEPL|nr:unnamed protein product [Pleuronectes platessa]